MKLLKILPIIFAIAFLISINTAYATNSTCIYYFYGNGCPHCARVDPFIDQMASKYPNLEVHKFEIYNNKSNALLLNSYFDSYQVPNIDRGIPIIFISNKYLSGDRTIFDSLENDIIANSGAVCPQIKETPPSEMLPLITIIGAAIVDSINPCAIAVLLVLMSTLLIAGDRKKALKVGLAFTISIYIVYLLFGLGLFSALKLSGLSYWFYKVIGFFAILVGLLELKDYFWYRAGGFAMEIPRRFKPTLKKILEKAVTPIGAFFIGFAVCLFELPCTGGPYIFILGLLAEKSTQIAAIPILLLYNFFFVLPLIIIIFLIYKGFTSIEKTKEWKDRNKRRMNLITGIVMLALGMVVILGLI